MISLHRVVVILLGFNHNQRGFSSEKVLVEIINIRSIESNSKFELQN